MKSPFSMPKPTFSVANLNPIIFFSSCQLQIVIVILAVNPWPPVYFPTADDVECSSACWEYVLLLLVD